MDWAGQASGGIDSAGQASGDMDWAGQASGGMDWVLRGMKGQGTREGPVCSSEIFILDWTDIFT